MNFYQKNQTAILTEDLHLSDGTIIPKNSNLLIYHIDSEKKIYYVKGKDNQGYKTRFPVSMEKLNKISDLASN